MKALVFWWADPVARATLVPREQEPPFKKKHARRRRDVKSPPPYPHPGPPSPSPCGGPSIFEPIPAKNPPPKTPKDPAHPREHEISVPPSSDSGPFVPLFSTLVRPYGEPGVCLKQAPGNFPILFPKGEKQGATVEGATSSSSRLETPLPYFHACPPSPKHLWKTNPFDPISTQTHPPRDTPKDRAPQQGSPRSPCPLQLGSRISELKILVFWRMGTGCLS
ncbi:vegetative cell wall protein gp1-like [Penaeus monodon]|uniref:vegetative cell wall protein gp1-like n=1 Tax=Penaeus monodon TaxID=6687 RepID=UPI0018A75D2E|nr:vegetative cell wall protein gp1-like [Penaeus monodon]